MAGIAAAAAVAQIEDVGVLSRPGRTPAPKKGKSGSLSSLTAKPAPAGLRRLAKVLPVVAILVLVVGAVVPRVLGSMTLSKATSTHTSAQATAQRYQSQIAVYNYVTGLTVAKSTVASTIPWGTLLPAVFATAPSGLTITNMIVSSTSSTITFNTTVLAQPATALPQWLAVLQSKGVQATTTGFSVDGAGKATSTVIFSVPRSFH